jgi:hypothetical protein
MEAVVEPGIRHRGGQPKKKNILLKINMPKNLLHTNFFIPYVCIEHPKACKLFFHDPYNWSVNYMNKYLGMPSLSTMVSMGAPHIIVLCLVWSKIAISGSGWQCRIRNKKWAMELLNHKHRTIHRGRLKGVIFLAAGGGGGGTAPAGHPLPPPLYGGALK